MMSAKKYLATLALVACVSAGPDEEKVTSIPDYPEFTFGVYSGYINNLNNTTKNIHYLLAESQGDPRKDPLIVWYNGGHGCSSMLAWAQEHGPFLQESTSQAFHKNPYSWNTEANVLYIEQPAGVGYSSCDWDAHPEDCTHDDNSAARDNLEVLLQWFEKYPEYKTSDLYVSGESYGGIYVPFAVN